MEKEEDHVHSIIQHRLPTSTLKKAKINYLLQLSKNEEKKKVIPEGCDALAPDNMLQAVQPSIKNIWIRSILTKEE